MSVLSPNPTALTTTGATAATGIAKLSLTGSNTLAQFEVYGTYGTVTFVFEGSFDGTHFFAIPAVQAADGVTVTSTIAPADNATYAWNVPCVGMVAVRLNISAIASGTINVLGQASAYVGAPTLGTAGGTSSTATVTNQAAAADGAITTKNGTVMITKGTAAALTLTAPTATTDDYKTIVFESTTAAAHTVTQTTPGFNNGGSASDVATFGATIGNGFTVIAYQGVWYKSGTALGVTLG